MSLWRSKSRVIAAVLTSALTVSVLGLSTGPPAFAGHGTLSGPHVVVHDGLNREYYKYVPPNLPAGARQLVIVLHGGNQYAYDAATQSTSPQSYWKTIADTDGLIVVYPQATLNVSGDPHWNDCRSSGSRLTTADDVGFIDAMIGQVSSGHDIDAGRVYATGGSNGGMMSYRLAFQLSHKIAAIGAVIANIPDDPAGECPAGPANPISVAIANGDGDTYWMPFNGGCVANFCAYHGSVTSTDSTVTFWRNHNGANGGGSLYTYANSNTTDNSKVQRRVYTGGSQGTEVPYFKVVKLGTNGAGHAIPSLCCYIGGYIEGSPPFGVGKQNRDIEGNQRIWNYLKNHTLTS